MTTIPYNNIPPYNPTPTIVQSGVPQGTDQSDVEPSHLRTGPMPTVRNVKDHCLFGIPLRSTLTKEQLPDSTIQDAIVKAVSEIEHTLKLYITPVTIHREPYNYSWNEFYYQFAYIRLNNRPVLEVQKLEVSIPSATNTENLVEWPTQWLKVFNAHGTIQLVPLTGSGSLLVTQVSSGITFPIRMFNADNFPQFWRVTYRTGFEVDQIPQMIIDLIEVVAALKVLDMVGPVIFPYQSYGISSDGLSQSVSTPGPNWFSARIQSMIQKKETLLSAAKSMYELGLLIDTLG